MTRARTLMVAFAVAGVATATLSAGDNGPAAFERVDAKTIRSRVPNLETLRPKWEEVMKARGIPGMAVVVVQGDELIYSQALGERNPEKRLPVTMDTMFYIASCTKSYMAMGIMSLVEEGKVELDAPIKTYLPRFELADAGGQDWARLRRRAGSNHTGIFLTHTLAQVRLTTSWGSHNHCYRAPDRSGGTRQWQP